MELLVGIILWVFLLIILPIWIKKAESISKFTLRRKPKLLTLYKYVRELEKVFGKIFIYLLKAMGILIAIVLFCCVFNWAANNPLYIIIFLLILILLKK